MFINKDIKINKQGWGGSSTQNTNSTGGGATKVAWWVRALAAPAEDLGSMPSTTRSLTTICNPDSWFKKKINADVEMAQYVTYLLHKQKDLS